MTLPGPCPGSISIHAPREGCDGSAPTGRPRPAPISIHAPREGCDSSWLLSRASFIPYFNPRTPRGVRLLGGVDHLMEDLISIHAPREGCDHRRRLRLRPQAAISIHAPREGCDGICEFLGVAWRDISIHAPREGCDSERTILIFFCYLFQSTHPARGATVAPDAGGTGHQHFNPRTPRGVRHLSSRGTSSAKVISIHAPREGCDPLSVLPHSRPFVFQSTHPARGATANFTKEQRVCLAQFAYLHKGKKAEHTKTNAPMLHEAFLYAFWVRTGRRRRVLLDFARYKIKGSSGR